MNNDLRLPGAVAEGLVATVDPEAEKGRFAFYERARDALVTDRATVPYPSATADFQHEVELVLAIGREGVDIPRERAAAHVFGLAVGIDLTRRDVQVAARKSGRPWEIGKSFDRSAPCGDLLPLRDGPLPSDGKIELRVNDQVRQSGDLSQIIWACDEIVSQLSRQYRLMPGDLICTGTPAGIGPMGRGDRVHAQIERIGTLAITIAH